MRIRVPRGDSIPARITGTTAIGTPITINDRLNEFITEWQYDYGET